MSALKNVEPEAVFELFEGISMIPRGSGNEREVCDYLERLFTGRDLQVHRDAYNNLIVYKPASAGHKSL